MTGLLTTYDTQSPDCVPVRRLPDRGLLGRLRRSRSDASKDVRLADQTPIRHPLTLHCSWRASALRCLFESLRGKEGANSTISSVIQDARRFRARRVLLPNRGMIIEKTIAPLTSAIIALLFPGHRGFSGKRSRKLIGANRPAIRVDVVAQSPRRPHEDDRTA